MRWCRRFSAALVENAIRHGIGEHARAGVVYVMGYRRDESIILQVRDNGAACLRTTRKALA